MWVKGVNRYFLPIHFRLILTALLLNFKQCSVVNIMIGEWISGADYTLPPTNYEYITSADVTSSRVPQEESILVFVQAFDIYAPIPEIESSVRAFNCNTHLYYSFQFPRNVYLLHCSRCDFVVTSGVTWRFYLLFNLM